MEDVLGLTNEGDETVAEGSEDLASSLLDLLVEMRSDAKENKEWDSADRIRKTLSELGITIKDSKEGSSWSNE
jgi:cysteinyl-tRNA synthetase